MREKTFASAVDVA